MVSAGQGVVEDGFQRKAHYYANELLFLQVTGTRISCGLRGVVIRVSCFSALHIPVDNFEYGPSITCTLKFSWFYISVPVKQSDISVQV